MNLKTLNSAVYRNMELATKGSSGIKEFQYWDVSIACPDLSTNIRLG